MVTTYKPKARRLNNALIMRELLHMPYLTTEELADRLGESNIGSLSTRLYRLRSLGIVVATKLRDMDDNPEGRGDCNVWSIGEGGDTPKWSKTRAGG